MFNNKLNKKITSNFSVQMGKLSDSWKKPDLVAHAFLDT